MKKSLLAACCLLNFSTLCSTLHAYQGHGLKSVSRKELAAFAPKTISSGLSNNIRRFLDLVPPGSGMLSPDARALYFSWKISGFNQIWKLNGPNQFPQMLTSGDEKTSPVAVTGDGKYLVISRDANGQENPGLYLLSIRDNTLKEIYRKAGVQCWFNYVSRDSQTIYYGTNERRPDSYALYAYNIASGKTTEVFSEPGLWSIQDVSADEKEWILAKSITNYHDEFSLFDPQTKKLRPLLGQGDNEEYHISFAAKKNFYLVRTNKLSDFHQLYEWSEGKDFRPLTAPVNFDVAGFQLSANKKLLFYSTSENGYMRLHQLDPYSYKSIPLPEFKGATSVHLVNIADDERHLTLAVESALRPRSSYVYDVKTKGLVPWMTLSTPEIDLSQSVPEKLEFYSSRDGVQIPMFVYRPQKCIQQSCPVIVNFHGGPEGQSTPGFDVYTQILIREGFVVVEPNVRGSVGFGKKWLTADDGPKRITTIADIEDCSIHIRKNWTLNGQIPKVGVMGWSYGGYSTLMAMSYFAGAYDAGVSLVGISNLTTFLNNTAPYRRALRVSEYGDPKKDASALKTLSPSTHMGKIKAPLMVIQGAEDPRVPVGEALQFYKLLRTKKIPSELIIFADEGHGSAKKSNQILELGNLIEFFKTHLK